jgi:phosphatidylglycerol lysyltransferase
MGAAVWLMLFAYKHVEYDHSLWLQFAFEDDAPRSLRALLAAVLAICGYALLSLPRSSRRSTVASENDTAAPKDRVDAGLD